MTGFLVKPQGQHPEAEDCLWWLAANRVMQAMFMLLDAKRWIERELPWWRRKQGADHIWCSSAPPLFCVCSATMLMSQKMPLAQGQPEQDLPGWCPSVRLTCRCAGEVWCAEREVEVFDGVQAGDA